ncbi:MAG: hypothetical protein ACLS6O_04190 [Bifidobacterium sp.]
MTDYKESVDIDGIKCLPAPMNLMISFRRSIDEFQNYENQFLKDEDLARLF